MNRLVITKLQPLRFAIFLSRSNMLVQSHGIFCCRASVYGGGAAVEAAATTTTTTTASSSSPSFGAAVWRPLKSYNWSGPRFPPARNAYANGNRVASKENASNSLECWKLWQTMNCSVADIVRRRGLTEFQVYEQICECVQQGKEIDWFDLCQEAGFSPQIVFAINDAKEKAKEALNEPLERRLDEFGRVPVQCGHHVTDIHVLLYNTMMTCGITPHEMFLTPMGERPSQVPEKVAPPKRTISKLGSGPTKKAAVPNGKLTSSPSPEEPDSTKTTPKRLTQKHMLQWMNDRNGVTLMELVLEFQGYNECQLMRLILLLERKKLIQLSQGIFRVTAPDDQASM